MVLSLSAKGLTTGEISAHLAEVYGASVSKDTISASEGEVLHAIFKEVAVGSSSTVRLNSPGRGNCCNAACDTGHSLGMGWLM